MSVGMMMTLAGQKLIFFVNLMPSSVQIVEVSIKGTLVSTAKKHYPFRALVEAEFSQNASCKQGWLQCHGFELELDRVDLITGQVIRNRLKMGNNLKKTFPFRPICQQFLG